MKNYKTLLSVAAFVGCMLLGGCGNTYVESQIEYETERNFVVEFQDNVEVTEDMLTELSATTGSVVKAHPYEKCYRFESQSENPSYAEVEKTCDQVSALPYVKSVHPEWY